jgi:hypothetical protein
LLLYCFNVFSHHSLHPSRDGVNMGLGLWNIQIPTYFEAVF